MNTIKTLAVAALLFASPVTHAVDAYTNPYAGEDMQRLMQMMQEAQSCMEKVDTAELERLHKTGQAVEARVKKLCKSGNKSAALKEGKAFARKVHSSRALKQMRIYTNKLSGLLPPQTLSMINKLDKQQSNADENNVCVGL